MAEDDDSYKKVILIGPPKAGKTSFFNKITIPGYTFDGTLSSTKATDIRNTQVKLANNKVVNLKIADTPGDSFFGASGTGGVAFTRVRIIVFLFDLNTSKSFESVTIRDRISNLEYEISKRHIDMKDVDFLMVGNKSDLESHVDQSEIITFVEEALTPEYVDESGKPIKLFRLPKKYFSCSVKTGEGVEDIVQYIAQVVSKDPPPKGGNKSTIKLEGETKNTGESGESKCC